MSASASAAASAGAARPAAFSAKASKYVCGSCGHSQELSQRDQVRCRVCGYRIFYKVRTERREWRIFTPMSRGPFWAPGGGRAWL